MDLKNVKLIIKEIQTGQGFDRSDFPEEAKGRIPRDKWDDGLFYLGMEYGALLILFRLKKEMEAIKH